MLKKQQKRYQRHRRVRAKISGTSQRPRLSVFRSAKHIHVQVIDDEKGKTLASASDQEIKKTKTKTQKTKVDIAREVGKLIAKKTLALPAGRQGNKIEKVVFDRGGYRYHGRTKALAEGAREGGLKF